MDELREQAQMAKLAAFDIDEGKKSKHWGHIRKKLEGWLMTEKKHLELLNSRLIRTPEDIEERNDAVKKVDMLRQFLEINETILEEKLAVIGRLSVPMTTFRKDNFVGNNGTNSNGGN